jgi:hypothetical protein
MTQPQNTALCYHCKGEMTGAEVQLPTTTYRPCAPYFGFCRTRCLCEPRPTHTAHKLQCRMVDNAGYTWLVDNAGLYVLRIIFFAFERARMINPSVLNAHNTKTACRRAVRAGGGTRGRQAAHVQSICLWLTPKILTPCIEGSLGTTEVPQHTMFGMRNCMS